MIKLNNRRITNGKKKKKEIIILLLAVLFFNLAVLPVVYASIESFGTFKQNQPANLVQNYNASTCNITSITAPDSTLIISGHLMTKNGLSFNYTVKATNTTQLGKYNVCGDCDQVPWCANFLVTPNGTEMSTAQGILYLVFLIGAISIFFLCLYYTVKIPWKHQRDNEGYVVGVNELRYVKLFLIVVCYLILMFTSGLLRGITANYIPDIGVAGFFEWIFWIMLSCAYPIIVCSLIFALIIFLSNKKFLRAIQRGLPME